MLKTSNANLTVVVVTQNPRQLIPRQFPRSIGIKLLEHFLHPGLPYRTLLQLLVQQCDVA